jgi:hypothetical protein
MQQLLRRSFSALMSVEGLVGKAALRQAVLDEVASPPPHLSLFLSFSLSLFLSFSLSLFLSLSLSGVDPPTATSLSSFLPGSTFGMRV